MVEAASRIGGGGRGDKADAVRLGGREAREAVASGPGGRLLEGGEQGGGNHGSQAQLMAVLEAGDHAGGRSVEAERGYRGARGPQAVALGAGEVPEGRATGGAGQALLDPRQRGAALRADELARLVAPHAARGPQDLGEALPQLGGNAPDTHATPFRLRMGVASVLAV